MDLQPVLHLLKYLNVRIVWAIEVFEFLQVRNEIEDNRLHIIRWVEAEYVGSLFRADLVVSEILNVLDVQADLQVHVLSNGILHKISHLAHCVVPGSDVENSRNL